MTKIVRQKPPRPADMSQLDYLWTYFGGYGVAEQASTVPQSDVILTEAAVTSLIKRATSGGMVNLEYRNHPTKPELVQLIGTDIDGGQLSIVDMPKEVHVVDFKRSSVTQQDIDKGCPFQLGANVLVLTLSNGKIFYVDIDEFAGGAVIGSETDTIRTKVIDDVIKSDLKIDVGTNTVSAVELKSNSDGVYANLKLDPSDTGVVLSKTDVGLQAKIPLKNSLYSIRFQQLTLLAYMNIPTKDEGTIYFITDKPYIYLGNRRYGIDINPGEVPIVSLIYDSDHMLMSYKKADGSDIQQIHLGPVTDTRPGMLSTADYVEFKAFSKALEGIIDIKEYVKDETDQLAISLEYGEPFDNRRPLYLKNRLGNTLSTVLIDIDNFLAAAQNRLATQQDVEDAILTGVTNINVGDPILVITLVDGSKVFTNLRELVVNYKFGRTPTVTLSESKEHYVYADLNMVESKVLYSSADGVGANVQVFREGNEIVVYGKTKTADCVLGRFGSPNMELVSGFFKDVMDEFFVFDNRPDYIDWLPYNQFTNAPVIGDPYYILTYRDYTDDPNSTLTKSYWVSLKPILNMVRLSAIPGNLIKKDSNNDLYAILEWTDITE